MIGNEQRRPVGGTRTSSVALRRGLAEFSAPYDATPDQPLKEKKTKKEKKDRKPRMKRGVVAASGDAEIHLPERADLGLGFGACYMCGAMPCLNRGCSVTNRIVCDTCWPDYVKKGCRLSRSSLGSREPSQSTLVSEEGDSKVSRTSSAGEVPSLDSLSLSSASKKDARPKSPPVPNVKRQHNRRSISPEIPTSTNRHFPGFQHTASVATWMMPLPRPLKIGISCSSTRAPEVSARTPAIQSSTRAPAIRSSRSSSRSSSRRNKENIVGENSEKTQARIAKQSSNPYPYRDNVSQPENLAGTHKNRDKTFSDLELKLDQQLGEAVKALADMEAKATAAAARVSSYDEKVVSEDTDGKCEGKAASGHTIIELGTDDSVRFISSKSSERSDPGKSSAACVTDDEALDTQDLETCILERYSQREDEAVKRLKVVNEKIDKAASRVQELEQCNSGSLPHWVAVEIAEDHLKEKKMLKAGRSASSAGSLEKSVSILKEELAVQHSSSDTAKARLAEMEKKEHVAKERIRFLEATMKQKEQELQDSMKTADGLIKQLKQSQEKRDADMEAMRISLEETATRNVEQANFYGCVNGGSASSFFSGSWFGFTSFCRSFT